jgi:kynurenine formamidase
VSVIKTLLAAIESTEVEVIDLTSPLSSSTPVLQLPEPFANTLHFALESVSDFNDAGPAWGWNDIHTGEHTGTHLDAPTHWISGRDGLSVDKILPTRLIGAIAVIDKTAETEANPDYLLEPEDIRAWEAENGPLPKGSWLLMRTGWSSRGHDSTLFTNADDTGPHTPGVSVAGADWLANNTEISGFETVVIDAGAAGGFEPPFPAHNFLLGADKYGLTQLRNLDTLPTVGAAIIVLPLPIVGGTGSPARVFALVERSTSA